MKNITEILLWKYPGCQFAYQGDGTHLGAKTMPNGDQAFGLDWAEKDIPKPIKKDVEEWEAGWLDSLERDKATQCELDLCDLKVKLAMAKTEGLTKAQAHLEKQIVELAS